MGVTFEGALWFTKLSVYLACTWPPPRIATKWEIMKYNIVWWVFFLSALSLFFPLVFSISKYRSNTLIVTQSVCFLGAGSNLLFKMIVYRLHFERTQTLIHEMETFLKTAKPHEIMILQRYLDKCSTFHIVVSIVNYLTAAMVATAPFLDPDRPLPTCAVYPVPVESGLALYLVYAHQSLAGFQCSSGVSIDCQTAMMMWFASARLEILANEFTNVNDIKGLRSFVMKYRRTISYTLEVADTMSYIALASSTACGVAAIMSSLQLLGNQPVAVKMQFGPVALIATINLFICAWPADNLISVFDFLANAVYNSSWINMSLEMMNNVLMILRRSQRPTTVSVAGFMPTLSLKTYASFLSAAFSYFTTLRLFLTPDETK